MKKIILSILTTVAMSISVIAQIPTTDLIGQYDFSNGGLTDNINSADFTKTGTASTSITDRFGNANEAISLNGDDLLRSDIDFNLSSSNPFLARTISFWVKTATNDGNVRLIYNDNNRTNVGAVNYSGLIVFLQNGQVKASNRVGSNGNLVTHSTPVSDDNWHHVVIQGYSTEISGTKRFYTYVFIDGIKEGGNGYQTGSSTVSATENEHIGSIGFSRLENLSIGNSQKYIDGLDEVLFYTKVLTDLEVDSITTNGFCTVNIPDANFKAYLLGNAAINTNGDTEIQCNEASTFTGILNCSALSISDLTGIEAFTSLLTLECHDNALSSLDITQNISLNYLKCSDNLLSSLDVTQNVGLSSLLCDNNSLSSLDVTQNIALQFLDCQDNFSLSSLDVTQNPDLISLRCFFASLTSLDVTQNPNLIQLYCDFNSISSLDLSQNSALILLHCNDNSLSTLNVANGNNANMNSNNFRAGNNANLTCITVDDVNYSATNWTSIDVQTSFSTNCSVPVLVSSINVQGQSGVSVITAQGGTLQMEATVLPANADDATYTWSVMNGSGTAILDANGLLTAITDGTVTVIANANDASGVAGTATITISNQGVGLDEASFKNINIFPNPAQDQLFIELDKVEITGVNITDLSGKVVVSIPNFKKNSLDVSFLSQGSYLIMVTTPNDIIKSHFMKQ